MNFTKVQLKELYTFIKNDDATFEDLFKKYGIKIPDNAVYYNIHIDFKYGEDYNVDGLINKKCYKWALQQFNDNKYLCLGDVNGKYSDVTVCLNDGLTFSDEKEIIEKYICENGNKYNNDLFYENMSENSDNEDDTKLF